jgi:hypothetical protein
LGDTPDTSGGSGRSFSERRRAPRYNFVATAEITDDENAAKLSGRVTEISRYGCYVDIANALPVGTVVNMRISCDQGAFVSKGKILYVQELIGIGVVFLDTPKEQLELLDSWLAGLGPSSNP